MPPMSPTGTKSPTSRSVVAHREADLLVALRRRRETIVCFSSIYPIDVSAPLRVVDYDADREGQRSICHRIEREAHVPDEGVRLDDRVGMRYAGNVVDRRFIMNSRTTSAQDRSETFASSTL